MVRLKHTMHKYLADSTLATMPKSALIDLIRSLERCWEDEAKTVEYQYRLLTAFSKMLSDEQAFKAIQEVQKEQKEQDNETEA